MNALKLLITSKVCQVNITKAKGLMLAVAVLGALVAPSRSPSADSSAGAPVSTEQTGLIVGTVTGRTPQHTVVYLSGVQGEFKPPTEPVELDQKDKTFIPHVLPVLKGRTVRFANSDFNPDGTGLSHNVKFVKYGRSRTLVMRETTRNLTNFMVWPDRPKDAKTIRPGKVALLCNIHPEMEGYVIVLDNPYFTVADASGEFELEAPEGAYTLKAWHPRYEKKEFGQEVIVTPGGKTEANIQLKK